MVIKINITMAMEGTALRTMVNTMTTTIMTTTILTTLSICECPSRRVPAGCMMDVIVVL